MTDNQKTVTAAAILAAAVGVYLEMARHDALRSGPPGVASTNAPPSAPRDAEPAAPHHPATKPGVE